MPKNNRLVLIGRVMAVVLIVGLLAGCGSSSKEESSTRSTGFTPLTQQDAEEIKDESAESAESFTADFWVTSNLEQGDGSTAQQRFGLGELSPADRFAAPNGFSALTNACEVDSRRDALIPGVLIVKDTTERFPIELNTGVIIERPFQAGYTSVGPETDIAQAFSSGPSCAPFNDPSTNAEVTFNLTEEETGRHKFLIVVHNYYSPGHPQGDTESLGYLRVGFFPAIYTGWEPLCISASAPLEDGFVRPDGGPISEQDHEQYETSPHAQGWAGVPHC
jgi:hypothetical protein